MLWKISPENMAQNQIRVRFPADTLHLACKGIKMRLKTGANTFAREEKINMQSNTYKWEQRQWWRVGRSQNQDKLGWVKRMGVQKNECARKYHCTSAELLCSWLHCGTYYWCRRKFGLTGNKAASCPAPLRHYHRRMPGSVCGSDYSGRPLACPTWGPPVEPHI